jgi:hypothetical protein
MSICVIVSDRLRFLTKAFQDPSLCSSTELEHKRSRGGAVYHGSTLLTSQYFVGCVILSTCNIVENKLYNPLKVQNIKLKLKFLYDTGMNQTIPGRKKCIIPGQGEFDY